MTELELYQRITEMATAFQQQYKEVAMVTMEDEETLKLTIVNHKSPHLSHSYTCKVKDKKSRLMFSSHLMELRFRFEREREANIRYGVQLALQHMKESALEALSEMDPVEIKKLVDEEIQKRKPK